MCLQRKRRMQGRYGWSEKPSPGCKDFLDKNEKAAAQWELERRFEEFEAKWVYVPQTPQKND